MLEASVDALLLSEDTLPKLILENEHLQKNITNLTQQLDTADRQREEERAARKALEESRDSKIKEVETSWRAVVEEKQDNWESKERSLENKIESQERLLNELKASYEVSQRLGQSGDSGDEARNISASAAELEIVSSDLDRTSQRLVEVEARNEQLRVELAEASSSIQRKSIAEDDANNARLRSENSALLRKLDSIRLENDSGTRKRESRIRILEKNTQMLERDREGLRERVHSWHDYDEIKQELEIFKVHQINYRQILSLICHSPLNSPPFMKTTRVRPRMMRATVVKLRSMARSWKIERTHLNSYCSRGIRSSATRWQY